MVEGIGAVAVATGVLVNVGITVEVGVDVGTIVDVTVIVGVAVGLIVIAGSGDVMMLHTPLINRIIPSKSKKSPMTSGFQEVTVMSAVGPVYTLGGLMYDSSL